MNGTAVALRQDQVPSRFSPDQVDLIKRTICKGATDDELRLFMYQAEKTGLDPLARQIYSIERRERRNDQWVNVRSIQTSIDGFRLIAERSGKYAGQVGPYWCGDDGQWSDVWLSAAPPAAARIGVLRTDFREPCWGVARFDAYAQKKDGKPTRMWASMSDVMIAKCAEALALRKAFPQELSGLYTGDEMGQAANDAPLVDATPARPLPPQPAAPPHDPETSEVSPHRIVLPLTEDGRPNYIAWGGSFIAAIKSAKSQHDWREWQDLNQQFLAEVADRAPKAHKSLLGAIDATGAQFRPADGMMLEPEETDAVLA